jgi:serine protease
MLRFRWLIAAAVLGLAACDGLDVVQPEALDPSLSRGVQVPVEIEVKFAEALQVRLVAGQLRTRQGQPVPAVAQALARFGSSDLRPLHSLPEAQLEQLRQRAQQRSGRAAPDLGSWFRLSVPSAAAAEQLVAALRARPEVETAYLAPTPAPPPGRAGTPLLDLAAGSSAFGASLATLATSSTPSFVAQQGYLGPAPTGIDAHYAWTLPGGRGAGVKVVDMEYDWYFPHEDLQLSSSILLWGDRFSDFGDNHGTAVLGQLVALDNGFGVTGGVTGAQPFVVSPVFNNTYVPAAATLGAIAAMAAGDVLLIEQQIWGPPPASAYVPLEWIQSVFDAFVVARDLGIIVVEAAGNGNQNLDGPEFLGRFNRNIHDSGAIIVGAGSSTDRSRLSFSTYGSRVDVQGWGGNVTTTGYGGLFGTSKANYYTATFNGTSSASPIVATAAVALQGYAKASLGRVLTPAEVRTLLTTTGTPQGGNTSQHIGPLPNLRAALGTLGGWPAHATIDIQPNTISLSLTNVVSVYLYSTATFDASQTSAATTRLRVIGGDPTGAPVMQRNGAYSRTVRDYNGDGRPDVMLSFQRTALVAAGLSLGRPNMVLEDRTGAVKFEATDPTPPAIVN